MRQTFRWALIVLLACSIAAAAFGQTTTATIRGKVTNEKGEGLPNAEVNAVNTSTGFVQTVHSGSDGSFLLGGLQPGEWNIVVAAQGFDARSEKLTVLVGQKLDVNFVMTGTQVLSESITVIGNQAVETKTSEAATNVTPQQIEQLPQNERNFLNFAALAPGIHISTDPTRKTISGDAQPAEQTNVFIDGISQKNDVLQGGLSGQDSSRGNPFPQNAVQEFRVVTQNYSAQYDHASSAIITAVTKSGGNELQGQVFGYYQPKRWVAPTAKGFQFSSLTTNSSYSRWQSGASLGGPIIKDKLHFFASYEGDQEHATTGVALGNSLFSNQFGQFVGFFPSPFRSNLFFGKLSWQPEQNQVVDFSTNYRKEHEIRDFGSQTSFESGTTLRNWVYGATLRHQWNSNAALNQASLSLQRYGWAPTPLNPDLVGLNYEGVIRLGGNSTKQDFDQRRLELRDDYTFTNVKWMGDHSIQVGGNIDWMHYRVNKSLNGNPQYNFRIDPANGLTFDQPYEALFGFGNPILTTKNNEYGIYAQDSWNVNQHLGLTLGARWDYESHMLDQDYVTPANIVAGLTGHVNPNYFSNGNSRNAYKNEIQPRLGFTYDLRGDSKSVIFGGAGRYYDRLFLNASLDERYRLQFPVYRIEFSPTGAPRNGGATVKWDPSYLTRAGLNTLIANGQARPEIFLLWNDTKPPYSNQFNIGYRQALGQSWVGSVSYNGVRGYHGFTWLSASGLCCSAIVPGFGNVLVSDPEGKRYWYDATFLTLDRPYAHGWGARVAYTHADAKQTGNDLFSLDFPSAAQYGKHAVPGSERDRIVATGIWGLPGDVRFSTILSFGSGGAANLLDFSKGFGLQDRIASHAYQKTLYPPKTWGFADRVVDFRLEKDVPIGGRFSVGVTGEVFNAFNWANYGCLTNFLPPEGNPDLGKANCVVNLGRREQVGLKLNF
ncbi:MAG TPA: TonB-dependent receptor [Thermoanaerobaculia bacterium]|nr:TonB-dependent receptor [Thermoanaerobaculia bacterium]